MTLTRIRLQRFTAFDDLDLELSPGINVLVGANATGKTHLMKVCYAACDISKTQQNFRDKLSSVFLPSNHSFARLIRRTHGKVEGSVTVFGKDKRIRLAFMRDASGERFPSTQVHHDWMKCAIEGIFIPVKEMLSNAPGFRSLYAQREIHFEEVYADILDRAYLPPLREPFEAKTKYLIDRLEKAMGGEVSIRNEEFFLSSERGDIEFTLLAEGMRKLGLLWLLIRNGSLRDGSVLFWEEPETNLNPKLYGVVIEVLLELQRSGVQVFLATHDYGILKELDLRMHEDDKVAFHSLYRDEETEDIACNTTTNYLDIHPNVIAEAFGDLYDREIKRSLGSFGR